MRVSGDTAFVLAGLGHVCGQSGCQSQAGEILEELGRRSDEIYAPAYDLAIVNLGLGQVGEALACL